MALNLGDINFGLGVDTRRLSSSVNDVVKFGQAVNSAASASSAASKKTEAALRRQEKAALSALQQTLRFNESVRKAGAPTRLLTDSSRAFREYTKSVTSGTLTTLDFQRAQSKFQADVGRSQRSLNRFKQAADQVPPSLFNMTELMQNLASASVLAVGPLSGVGARITALTAIANRSNLAMVGLIGGITAGFITLSTFGQGAIQTAIQLDKVNARLESVTGSTEAAADAFARIQQLSDDTGSELIGVANAYAKISAAAAGTALAGAQVDQVFEDVLFGAAKFRIGTEELNGVLKAFEQIMSKGIVQSEELRGQLGDRLVGAFNIAAQSMGVTTAELNKMLKAGEVMSDEFLPKFASAFRAAVGADQVKRVVGLQASLNRLANSQTNFNRAFDETFGISQLFQASVESLTGVINFFADNMDVLAFAAAGVTGALLVIAGPGILAGFLKLVKIIRTATIAMAGLNAVMLANPAGAVLALVTRAAIGLAGGLAIAGVAMAGVNEEQTALVDTIDSYIDAQRRAQQTEVQTTGILRAQVADRLALVQSQLEQQRELFANPPESGGHSKRNAQDRRASNIARLNAEYDELTSKLKTLTSIQQAQQNAARARADAESRVVSAAEQDAIVRIERIHQEIAAMGQSEGALQALKAAFGQTDAIEKFRSTLEKAKVEEEAIIARTAEFSAALEKLSEAAQSKALADSTKEIERMRMEIEALGDGAQAVDNLKASFEQSDAIDAFRNKLIGAGVDIAVAEQMTAQFADQMRQLDETVRNQQMDATIAEVTAEIQRMTAEAVAIQEGEDAVRRLQEQFANTQQIETFRSRLEAAGVTGERLEAIITALTGALFQLNNVAGQARIDASLEAAGDATNRLRRETEALAGGKDAFTAFKNAERVTDNLSRLESTLKADGVDAAQITAALDQRRTALEANIEANTRYQASLAKGRGGRKKSGGGSSASDDLKDLNEQFTKLQQLQALASQGSQAFAILQQNLSVSDKVEAYRKSLAGANLTQEEVNEKVKAFRASIGAFDAAAGGVDNMKNALQSANSQLEDLLKRAEQLTSLDLGDLGAESGLQGAQAIAQYRSALEKMGISQEMVNQRVGEFRDRINEISAQEGAIQQIADLHQNVQDTISNGWGQVADVMADALVSGKLDLNALADVGKKVASELISSFLELAVIKPLLNSIFGGLGIGGSGGASFGQLFSGAGGNFFGTLFSRKGNAFGSNGAADVKFARKGALLTGPTAFGMQDGGVTIGGEAGDEGILPLARTSSGDLGVINAGGAGGGNTINFNFPPGTDAKSFQKSESQMSALASRVASRGGRNQ